MTTAELITIAEQHLKKVTRIFQHQAIWDLRMVAALLDKYPHELRQTDQYITYITDMKRGISLNPYRLRWMCWHNDMQSIINTVKESQINQI